MHIHGCRHIRVVLGWMEKLQVLLFSLDNLSSGKDPQATPVDIPSLKFWWRKTTDGVFCLYSSLPLNVCTHALQSRPNPHIPTEHLLVQRKVQLECVLPAQHSLSRAPESWGPRDQVCGTWLDPRVTAGNPSCDKPPLPVLHLFGPAGEIFEFASNCLESALLTPLFFSMWLVLSG